MTAYRAFLEAKRPTAPDAGVSIEPAAVHPVCKPHQRDLIRWGVRGGQRAYFCRFGLGKSIMQLETGRLVLEHAGGAGVIVAPLGMRIDFAIDAAKVDLELPFIRTTEELRPQGLHLTNYESVREGKLSLEGLTFLSLDEASVLRDLGSKTFREFYRRTQRIPFRYVATATPAPNDYIEILNYAMVLGIMDIGEAKTRFFRRNAEKSDALTLHPHKEREFWEWVHTWAVFLQRPSDLGYSDEGYELPPIDIRWHAVGTKHDSAGTEKDGQGRLLHDPALGVSAAAAAKRASLPDRIAKVRALVEARPDEHVMIWHDLEAEREALEAAVPGIRTVYGTQDLDERDALVIGFARGEIPRLAAKPVMLGSGPNLQHHCAWAVFAGVGFKFNDFIQSIHRFYRFQQGQPVRVDIVFAESEAEIVKDLKRKWKQYDAAMARMAEIIRRHGLASVAPHEQLTRSLGVERQEYFTDGMYLVNADACEEVPRRETDSVDLVVTSIPFSTQYEYTPSYHDFGHTDDEAHFWRQMDFLSPELLRVLRPGRILAVHVKDRVRPGGYDGRSFQSVAPFHASGILHFQQHGFVYLGMITVVTDVVRENNQTYRLGWTEQCKDGTRMGVGLPEYVLLFRKAPSDPTSGYADERVEKTKAEYSRARWQLDAHGFWRSSGNRLLTPEDLVGRPWKEVFRRFREMTLSTVYDHEGVVAIAEGLDAAGQLPPDFMLLQPASIDDEVWTDVTRMRTLNTAQSAAGREKHLCPLQFDIVDRLITRFSNPGDVVMDPFSGLGTVPLRALALGRSGYGVELNPRYWKDSVSYARAAAERRATPTLFDLLEEPAA